MYGKTAMVDEATEVVEAELCMVISLLATTCMARKILSAYMSLCEEV